MITLSVLAVGFFLKVIAAIWFLLAITVILIILVQKGKGGGLSSAFGGGGLASGLLGSKTGDFLTWVTIGVIGLFLIISVLMAKFYKPVTGSFGYEQEPASTSTEIPQSVPSGMRLPQEQTSSQEVQGMMDFNQIPAAAESRTEANLP